MARDKAISIYAELLSNIRQVSVVVSLSSGADASTRARVLDQGHRLKVDHQGQTENLVLPASVTASGILPIAQRGLEHLSWRLPLSQTDIRPSQFSAEDQVLPWTSLDLKASSPIQCRACGHHIVSEGSVKTWKDLPSENWAEMMEFWHCHKPHDHGQHDSESLGSKGYGANSTIAAQMGVGFVDLTSFLFSESDCNGLVFSSSTLDDGFDCSSSALDDSCTTKYLHVFCNNCTSEVGLFNVQASSVTLFKWQITCQTHLPSRNPSSSECLAATLTATISRSGSSKSVITPHIFGTLDKAETAQVLHIWVLNSNVVYSSLGVDGRKAAMKILYQLIEAEQASKMVESLNTDVQEISLPKTSIQAATKSLQLSSLLLPTHERRFKEWNVGLLGRWEPVP